MSRINLEQLRTFLSVVRMGGVGKAAQALNLTQPALSTRIRNLEQSLSAELFERTGTGIPLFPSSSLSACFRLVEAGLGVAALPRALGEGCVKEGKIVGFDPGWTPSPLRFSASYMGELRSYVVAKAAKLAQDVAMKDEIHKNS